MKSKRHIFKITAVLAASGWSFSANAQETVVEAGAELAAEATAEFDSDTALTPVTRASDRLMERVEAKYDNLSAEAQANVDALQASLNEIRAAWENEYKPGVEASVEEIIAAREQFKADLAGQIAATKELRKQVVTQLRDEIRNGVDGEEISTEARLRGEAYKEIAMELNAAWREARAQLGAEATVEEVEAAREAFLEANAELVAERKLLAAEMRVNAQANVRMNGAIAARGEAPEAIQEAKADLEITRNNLRQQREQAREQFRNETQEQREIHRQELVEELRIANNEMKERRRQLVDELRGEQDGDRRAED